MQQQKEIERQNAAWLDEIRMSCRLCPRECGIDRSAGETGYCGLDNSIHVYDGFVHHGEGAGLAPSFTVFLLGCNLRCRYCYTADERRLSSSEVLTSARLDAMMATARGQGALNINFIGGEPTMNLPALLEVLDASTDPLPLVWNTNGYATAEAFDILMSRVSTWLVDLKVGNSDCAREIVGADNYWQICRDRLVELYGKARERLVVRHLVMPGHLECCTWPVLEWIAKHLPGARVNLLLNYTPMLQARSDSRLGRFLTVDERSAVLERVRGFDLNLVSEQGGRLDEGHVLPVVSCKDTRKSLAEIVISPAGEIHIRHPTAAMVDMVRAALRTDQQQQILPLPEVQTEELE